MIRDRDIPPVSVVRLENGQETKGGVSATLTVTSGQSTWPRPEPTL